MNSNLIKGFTAIKFPVYYNAGSQQILDSNNQITLDVRGWGRISNMFTEQAAEVQDALGEFYAEAINAAVTRRLAGGEGES